MAIKLMHYGSTVDMYTDDNGRPIVRMSNGSTYGLMYLEEATSSLWLRVDLEEYTRKSGGSETFYHYGSTAIIGNVVYYYVDDDGVWHEKTQYTKAGINSVTLYRSSACLIRIWTIWT